MRLPTFLLLCFAATAPLSGALASTLIAGDSKTIVAAAQRFMSSYSDDLLAQLGGNARIEYRIEGVDSRLAMPACTQALEVAAKEAQRLGSRLNLQVSCRSGNTWSLFVPVTLAIHRPVVTTVRPLSHGETLLAPDLTLTELDVSRLSGQYLTALKEAVGMSIKRPLGQGSAVIAEHLQPPLLVRRGDTVVISAAGSTLAVKMAGVAMTDGRRGEQIRIKNNSSGKVVAGRVAAPGLVEVLL